MTKTYILRQANMDDLSDIVGLVYPRYFDESIYGKHMTASPEGIINYFTQNLQDESYYCLLGFDADNKAVSYASITFGKTFYEQVEGDVDFFYVSPEFRGSGISQAMVEKLLEISNSANAAIVYAASWSGVDDEKNNSLWQNLFKKFDFKMIGTTMAKIGA